MEKKNHICVYRWKHSIVMLSTVASQPEGSGFESWFRPVAHLCMISLCMDCFFSHSPKRCLLGELCSVDNDNWCEWLVVCLCVSPSLNRLATYPTSSPMTGGIGSSWTQEATEDINGCVAFKGCTRKKSLILKSVTVSFFFFFFAGKKTKTDACWRASF